MLAGPQIGCTGSGGGVQRPLSQGQQGKEAERQESWPEVMATGDTVQVGAVLQREGDGKCEWERTVGWESYR